MDAAMLAMQSAGDWRRGGVCVGIYAVTTAMTICMEKRSLKHYVPALPYVIPNVMYLFLFSAVGPTMLDNFYGASRGARGGAGYRSAGRTILHHPCCDVKA